MSALPMSVPLDLKASKLAELMIILPVEWNLDYESFGDERNYWPIRIMKQMMMLPHENNTWLGFEHTFCFEENEEFAPGIGFNSIMLAHSMELSDDFTNIEIENNNTIKIFTMIPLYKEELAYKEQHGANALLEQFDRHEIDEIVKVGRINVCK